MPAGFEGAPQGPSPEVHVEVGEMVFDAALAGHPEVVEAGPQEVFGGGFLAAPLLDPGCGASCLVLVWRVADDREGRVLVDAFGDGRREIRVEGVAVNDVAVEEVDGRASVGGEPAGSLCEVDRDGVGVDSEDAGRRDGGGELVLVGQGSAVVGQQLGVVGREIARREGEEDASSAGRVDDDRVQDPLGAEVLVVFEECVERTAGQGVGEWRGRVPGAGHAAVVGFQELFA